MEVAEEVRTSSRLVDTGTGGQVEAEVGISEEQETEGHIESRYY